jgi:glycyl-tRNA synthetase beta chain
MPVDDLLFELRTEELPPRTLRTLSTALAEGIVKGLDDAGIPHGTSDTFATPRRLAVRVNGCADFAPDRRIERRGPPLANAFDAGGSPTQAALAFARSCGVTVDELARLVTEKGSWLAYHGTEPGVATVTALPAIVTHAIAALPIAKRMRWGDQPAEFVRPVRSMILLLGKNVVPFNVLGLASGRTTIGHRFHAPRPLRITSPRTYERQLLRAKVMANFEERRATIRAGVIAAAAEAGGVPLIEDSLLDEVTALVEWPVPVTGRFEQRFLSLPREVVIATVQEHQRYFPIQDVDGRLTGGFVTVSNIASRDPSVVVAGNERVVRPRLRDAAFFWDQDRKVPLETFAARLGSVTFQTKLGSYAEKTARVRRLAGIIGERISSGVFVDRAAELAKADLMTAMVGEFPELQGIMGRYYAEAQGEPPEVALAIEEHYRPRYAGDALPSTKVGQTLSVADKLDTLVGIFAIDQKPTGTKDPFGLRRAALGVLRILLECRLDLDLLDLIRQARDAQPVQRTAVDLEVYDFIAERFRGLLLDRADGTTGEMIDAVLAGRPVSPWDALIRLQALKSFLLLPEAAVLTGINKRIGNILRKAPKQADPIVEASALTEEAERTLHGVLQSLSSGVHLAINERRYTDALTALTGLAAAVDDFFNRIMVMAPDPVLRSNRLALLHNVQALLGGVADLSRLPG